MPKLANSLTCYIYAAYIADGYLYAAEQADADDDGPEGEGYWFGLRHQEVSCPVCGGDERVTARDGRPVTCPECYGSGVTEGEPFTVTRYGPMTDEQADAALKAADQGDGYENAAHLAAWAKGAGFGEGVDVLNWEPERAEIPDVGDEPDTDDPAPVNP